MKKVVSLLMLLLGCACSGPLPELPLQNTGSLRVRSLGFVPLAEKIAVARAGRFLAWSGPELTLFDTLNQRRLSLADEAPDVLSWSPDGRFLVGIFPRTSGSRLIAFDHLGHRIQEVALDGRVSRLMWSADGHLMAGVLRIKNYSFGTHITAYLLSLNEQWQEERHPLYETTLTPSVAKLLGDKLFRSLSCDLSPLGDELLYTRLHAPPAFAASRQLVLHHLGTGAERVIETLPLLTGTGRLTADGESVLVDNGRGQIRQRDIWMKRAGQEWSGPLRDYHPASNLILTEQGLYHLGNLLFSLPAENQTALGPEGKYLAVAWSKALFLVSGYPLSQEPELSQQAMEKLLKLRRLRSRDLIDLQEYRKARERVLR